MADTKINDLPFAGTVTSSMQLETDIGGTTANKVTAEGIKDYVKANLGDFSAGDVNLTNLEIKDDSDDTFKILSSTLDTVRVQIRTNPAGSLEARFNLDVNPYSTNVWNLGSSGRYWNVAYINTIECVEINIGGVSDGILNIASGLVSSETATALATDGTLVRRGGAGLTAFNTIAIASSSTPSLPSLNFGTTTTGVSGTSSQVTVHVAGNIVATYTADNSEFDIVRVSNGSFSEPAISFNNNNYGLYASGSSINVKVNGLDRFVIGSNNIDVSLPMRTIHQVSTETSNYQLNYNDRDEVIYINSASDLNVTAPSISTDPLINIGASWVIVRKGTGAVTLVEDSGVSILSVDNAKKIANRYGAVTIIKTGSNEYHAMGDLVP